MTPICSHAGSRRRILAPSTPAALLGAAAITLLAAGSLRAQSVVAAPSASDIVDTVGVRPSTAAPVGGASATPETAEPTAPASSALSPAMTQEVYVAAFRASARQWCAGGSADALDAAARGTKSIAGSSVADGERAVIERAIDDARDELARAGGCTTLARPTRRVVVDGFEGHAWGAPRGEVTPSERGLRTDEGYVVVTRRVKVGARRFHRVSADAEYTFTASREELVHGRYRIASPRGDFAERWRTAERAIAERYPTLRLVRAGVPDGADPAAIGTAFLNPDTQALEARMFATPAGRDAEWVIVVDFPGYAGR